MINSKPQSQSGIDSSINTYISDHDFAEMYRYGDLLHKHANLQNSIFEKRGLCKF